MMIRILAGLVVVACMPLLALAHGSGVSLEQTVRDHRIDIGYDPAVLTAGERVVFDFSLFNTEKTEERAFDRAWVRIEADGRTLLATGVGKAAIGPTTLLLTLPDPSPERITLHARYEQAGESIVESSFDLPVVPREQPLSYVPFAAAGLGLLVGALIYHAVVFVQRRRRAGR